MTSRLRSSPHARIGVTTWLHIDGQSYNIILDIVAAFLSVPF